MAVKDWTKIYQNYKGLWVALKDDEETVITADEKLKTAMAKAKKMGYARPIMTKVPKHDYAHVGLRARRA